LITAKAEKPISHKYEEANGIKVLIALSAMIGYCFFIAIQNSGKDNDTNLDFDTESEYKFSLSVVLVPVIVYSDVRSVVKGSLIQFYG